MAIPTVTPAAGPRRADGVSVDAARVGQHAAAVPEARCASPRLRESDFQHVGFGVDFGDADNPGLGDVQHDRRHGLVTRPDEQRHGAGRPDTPVISRLSPRCPHEFRIDWNASSVEYYVDALNRGDARRLDDRADRPGQRLQDASAPLTVDSMVLRIEDDGHVYVQGLRRGRHARRRHQFTPERRRPPTGQDITYKTRSGNTAPTGDAGWIDWSSGATTSPRRYFQYRATLTTDDCGRAAHKGHRRLPDRRRPAAGAGHPPPGGGTPVLTRRRRRSACLVTRTSRSVARSACC